MSQSPENDFILVGNETIVSGVVEAKATSSSNGSRTSNSESLGTVTTSSVTSASPPIFEDKKLKRSLDETEPEPDKLEQSKKKARTDGPRLPEQLSKNSEEPFVNLVRRIFLRILISQV